MSENLHIPRKHPKIARFSVSREYTNVTLGKISRTCVYYVFYKKIKKTTKKWNFKNSPENTANLIKIKEVRRTKQNYFSVRTKELTRVSRKVTSSVLGKFHVFNKRIRNCLIKLCSSFDRCSRYSIKDRACFSYLLRTVLARKVLFEKLSALLATKTSKNTCHLER